MQMRVCLMDLRVRYSIILLFSHEDPKVQSLPHFTSCLCTFVAILKTDKFAQILCYTKMMIKCRIVSLEQKVNTTD